MFLQILGIPKLLLQNIFIQTLFLVFSQLFWFGFNLFPNSALSKSHTVISIRAEYRHHSKYNAVGNKCET